MNAVRIACVVSMLILTGVTQAQSTTTATSAESATSERVENGIPISRLLEAVQKKTHKKFVIDPRVRGNVAMLDQDLSNLSFNDLQTILHVYNYIAAEQGDYVLVVPDANARQIAGPVISGKEIRPDDEIVTKILSARNIAVAQLVPILRPMIPQYGHLAALPCTNKLIMVDTFANIRRMEKVIEALDTGEPYKPESCAEVMRAAAARAAESK